MQNWKKHRSKAVIVVTLGAAALGWSYQARTSVAGSSDPLIQGFRRTTIASVSDAVDQITGRRGFMDHDMQRQSPGKLVGRATTAVIRPTRPGENSTPSTAIRHAVEMIDGAAPGSVGIIVVEGGPGMTGLGGLMATAATARDMAGVVVDGSIRDVEEIRQLGLPVFARGRIPATAVGRFISVSRDLEVHCAGVVVRPGDIVVGGEDGVVVVPKGRAEAVLKRAREIDEHETGMVPFIKKHRSLAKAIELFKRI
jgi:regulator of RNase E activity RraA